MDSGLFKNFQSSQEMHVLVGACAPQIVQSLKISKKDLVVGLKLLVSLLPVLVQAGVPRQSVKNIVMRT